MSEYRDIHTSIRLGLRLLAGLTAVGLASFAGPAEVPVSTPVPTTSSSMAAFVAGSRPAAFTTGLKIGPLAANPVAPARPPDARRDTRAGSHGLW